MAENIIFIIVGDILQVVLHFSDPVGVRKMPATRKNVSYVKPLGRRFITLLTFSLFLLVFEIHSMASSELLTDCIRHAPKMKTIALK